MNFFRVFINNTSNMNSKRNMHKESPLTKCRPKRINSNLMKSIKGSLVPTLNIEDVSDETSSMQSDSWNTEMEWSQSLGKVDDVFEASTQIIPEADACSSPERFRHSDAMDEEKVLSTPETFRRSVKQRDEWSLCHLREDSITSSEKGAVDDILPSPERCSSSHSEKSPKGITSYLKNFSPRTDIVLPDFAECTDSLSKKLYDKNNAELEYPYGKIKPKVPKKNAMDEEKIFSAPETFRHSVKQHDEWSLCHLREDSITSSEKGAVDDILSSERCSSSHSEKSPKGITSYLKNFSPRTDIVLPDFAESTDSLSKKLYDKNNAELEYPYGKIKSKVPKKNFQRHHKELLHSTRIGYDETITSPRFEMSNDISSVSCNIKSNTESKDEHESIKKSTFSKGDITSKELPGAKSFSRTQDKKSSQPNKLKKDVSKGYSFGALPVSSKESQTLHREALIHSDEKIETLRQAKEDLYTTLKDSKKSARRITSHMKTTTPKTDPVLEDFENTDRLPVQSYDKNIAALGNPDRTIILPQKNSQRDVKKMLHSTRISQHETISSLHSKVFDDISSITDNIKSNTKSKNEGESTKKCTFSKQNVISKEQSKAQSFIKTQREKSSLANTLKKDALKRYSFEVMPVSSKEFKTLHSVTLIPSNKTIEALREANEDLHETPKGNRVTKIIKRKILLDKSVRHKTTKRSTLSELRIGRESKAYESEDASARNSSKTTTKQSGEYADNSKSKEVTREPSIENSEDNEIPKEIVTNLNDQSKKTAPVKQSKKNLGEEKATEESFKERFLSDETLVSVNQDIVTSAVSEDSWSLKVAEKKSVKSTATAGGKYSKKTSAMKLKKNRISTVTSSIKDFVVSNSEETSTHSGRTSEDNLDTSMKGIVGNDSLKIVAYKRLKRKRIQKMKEANESSQEEIISTPTSTTISEDSIEYMDDTESQKTNSEGSTEKFLEEYGLYESDDSTEKESLQSMKAEEKIKEEEATKDSWEEKSFSESLREYKDYLNTLPICELSLKKWRETKLRYRY